MFKKRTISNKTTFEYWQDLSRVSSERRIQNHLFQFKKKNRTTIITIKNEGMILNPEIDFLQARILNEENVIVVEIIGL